MNTPISVFGLILLLVFVSADPTIRLENLSSDAVINGIASWEPVSDTESSVTSTGQIQPGKNAILTIPSSLKKKISFSVNNFKQSDIIEQIFSQDFDGPVTKCFAVTGDRSKLTCVEKACP